MIFAIPIPRPLHPLPRFLGLRLLREWWASARKASDNYPAVIVFADDRRTWVLGMHEWVRSSLSISRPNFSSCCACHLNKRSASPSDTFVCTLSLTSAHFGSMGGGSQRQGQGRQLGLPLSIPIDVERGIDTQNDPPGHICSSSPLFSVIKLNYRFGTSFSHLNDDRHFVRRSERIRCPAVLYG